ncbi:MAG: phage shock protein PspA, partial [Psychromonas sp.]|nr:phage shock protein PspA [Psychromonas sp.]
LLADKKELQRRINRIAHQVDDWQAKAELALSKDREDLARGALMEKQKVAEQAELAAQDMQVIEEQLELLTSEITQLQAKLDEARARKKSMVIRKDTAATRLQVKKQLDSSSIQNSLDKFEQYERRIEDLESQVEAQDLGNKTLQQEFSELQADDAIADELEALKKKMKSN